MTTWRERRPSRTNIARFIGTAVIGVVALWLTFRGADLRLVVRAVQASHLWPIFWALLLVAGTVAVGAERWRLLVFPPPVRGGSYLLFVAALLTSQMLNALLPIRLGEFGRAYWIGRSGNQPLGRVLATIVAERLTDLLMLGVSLVILFLSLVLPPWADSSGRLALSVSALVLILAAVLGKWGRQLLPALERLLRWLPARLTHFILRHGDTALTEIAALGHWRSSASVWGLSALLVVLAAATNYALFFAFDLRLSPVIALLLFVVLQIGGAPVATPGNLGIFHLLTVLVLTTFGADRSVAVAYAVVLHLVAVGTKIVAGGVILATTRTPMFDARA